jgi:hypothetical protein
VLELRRRLEAPANRAGGSLLSYILAKNVLFSFARRSLLLAHHTLLLLKLNAKYPNTMKMIHIKLLVIIILVLVQRSLSMMKAMKDDHTSKYRNVQVLHLH